MAVYKHKEKYVDISGSIKVKETWRFRKQFRLADRLIKISGTPKINTKAAAEAAERKAIEEAERAPSAETVTSKPKEVPTFANFATTFMATYATTDRRQQVVLEDAVLRCLLSPTRWTSA